jgi:DNA-binding HxlR family transcriptional regulator
MSRVKKTMICPFGGVGVGGKWKFWIWYHLLDGNRRFGELQRLIPGSNRQTLTLQLRSLEQMGVLRRQAAEPGSTRTEYALTELAPQSGPMLLQMFAWGRWACDQLGVEFDWPVSDEVEERIGQRRSTGQLAAQIGTYAFS